MENKPAQNIQDTFLNTVRKDKTPITVYLVSGVKLTGKIRSFDKYSVLLENNSQEQLIFKHAISTVVSNRAVLHAELPPGGRKPWPGRGSARPPGPQPSRSRDKQAGSGLKLAVDESRAGGPSGLFRQVSAAEKKALSERFWWVWTLASAPAPAAAAQAGARLAAVCADPAASAPRLDFDTEGSLRGLAICLRQASPATAAQARSSTELDAEESLAEFRELVASAGGEVVAELLQRRARLDPATLIGAGKVEEIAGVAASVEADLVLFDHDLSPTQLRNLEAALPCRVLDRTQLILDIFARHARTSEGKLQVELAQLEYMLPRLTGKGKAMSQLGGGIGTRGPGETKLETDRRQIQRRIDHLKVELESVRRVRKQQRQRRESVPVPTVALVGYTNAGKSTLFNQLTGAQVLQSPKMFATLDPSCARSNCPAAARCCCPTRSASSATCPTRW